MALNGVSDMDDYEDQVELEHLIVIVTGTYGNGEAPYNAEELHSG